MELKPIEKTADPRYPTYHHERAARRWIRRSAAAGAMSLALAMGGGAGCDRLFGGEEATETQEVDEEMMRPGGIPPEIEMPRDAGQTPEQGDASPSDAAPTPPDAAPPVVAPPDIRRPGGVPRRPIPPGPDPLAPQGAPPGAQQVQPGGEPPVQ